MSFNNLRSLKILMVHYMVLILS